MRASSRFLVAAMLAAAPAVGQPPPGAADIVGRLMALPAWLQDFEAIVGPLERNRAVWEEAVGPLHRNRESGPIAHLDAAFTIDIYHFDPRQEENVQLASWNVTFRGGQDAALTRLRERFGDGLALAFAPGQPRRFGDLYFTSLPEGRFELSWYAEEPQWAVPQRGEAGDRALEDRLVAFLRGKVSEETIAKSFAPLSPIAGRSTRGAEGEDWRVEVSPDQSGRPDWISIEVRGLPLRAQRLVDSLGMRDPGFIATDVHLSGPYLVDLATGKRPVVDGYRLTLQIDHQLLDSVPAKRRGTAAWKPKEWKIRGVWLSPAD